MEAWGRGIQKICEACEQHGSPNPEYNILGSDITVKFTARQSAKILKRQNGALDGTLGNNIIEAMKSNPNITLKGLTEKTTFSRRTIQRKLAELQNEGVLERKGGKRYGYWEIHDE